MTGEVVMAKGLVERIGIEGGRIKHTKTGMDPMVSERDFPNHKVAIKAVLDCLLHGEHGSLRSLEELKAVGHRVVHGGEKFAKSVVVTEDVLKTIDECTPFAPLHNPANLLGIRSMMEVLPTVPQIAVFDTAFHQTMPERAYIYGIPYRYYEEHHVRRFGFHGTSHLYVAHRAAEILEKPLENLKIVTCHLGNGSSISAVDGGKSVDTTLGFGTVSGVLMGTRCGDVDPVAVLHLMQKEGLDAESMSHVLHKDSGMLGVSGISSDLRDVEDAAAGGDRRAKLALDILCYGVRKYIGAYAAAMGGLNAVVFTAGVGENSILVREMVCEGLDFLGACFDKSLNTVRGKEARISKSGSKVALLVIPTNEELVIARDTFSLVP